MEVYVRDIIRLMSELIVENFTIEELAKITNLQIIDINAIEQAAVDRARILLREGLDQIDPNDPQAAEKQQALADQGQLGVKRALKEPVQALKGYAVTPEQLEELEELKDDDKMRSFSVDVETDSTVRIDQDQEKSDRIQYVNAISNYAGSFFPLVQAGIITPTAFNEFLGFISRPFKVGRNLEQYLLSEEEVQVEPEEPSAEEVLAQEENRRRDFELELKASVDLALLSASLLAS